MTSTHPATVAEQECYRQILGVRFFCGSVASAIHIMKQGGLLVVPAAPALKDIGTNGPYREALLDSDLSITDSAFMVMIWNLIQRDHVSRLSGLEYLRDLLFEEDVRRPGNTLWIMAGEKSAQQNLAWLAEQGITVPPEMVYLAPMYQRDLSDEPLLEMLRQHRPQHVIVTVGGGTQERLGLYLKRNLNYLPAIHCIGAAIAFLSGDQVHIPVWADKFYLGWMYRCISEPSRYIPRYWDARKLMGIMVRYRAELPPLVDRRQR